MDVLRGQVQRRPHQGLVELGLHELRVTPCAVDGSQWDIAAAQGDICVLHDQGAVLSAEATGREVEEAAETDHEGEEIQGEKEKRVGEEDSEGEIGEERRDA